MNVDIASRFKMKSQFAWIAVVLFTFGATATSLLKVLQYQGLVTAETEGMARLATLGIFSIILFSFCIRSSIDVAAKWLVIAGLTLVITRSFFGYSEDVAAWNDIPLIGAHSHARQSIESVVTGLWIASACSAGFFALRSIERSRFELNENIIRLEESDERCRRTNNDLTSTLDSLKRTQDELIRQERLRTIGEMASGLAHDLNNALTPIVAYSQLLVQSRDATEEQRADWTDCIERASEDVIGIARGLSAFHPRGTLTQKRRETDLGQLVEQVVRITRPKWIAEAQRRGVEIEFVKDLERGITVNVDPVDVRVALTNLIFNAVEAIDGKGSIAIRLTADAKHAILFVSNTGEGMTPEDADRCFEPFFTTKESGSGLGLAMCKRVIERYDGTIELVSPVAGETTFQITIPVVPAQNAVTNLPTCA